MNKTTAINQAIKESSMDRFGNGWTITTFDESVNAWRESREMPFFQARGALSGWRVWRATQLLTGDTDAANGAEYDYFNTGGRWQAFVQSN